MKNKTQWRYITATSLLSKGECELISAVAAIDTAASTKYFTIYNGEDTEGEIVINLLGAVVMEFTPPEPVYCARGLYIAKTSTPSGLFVQWREVSE